MIKILLNITICISCMFNISAQNAEIEELPTVCAKILFQDDTGKPLVGVQVGAGCSAFRGNDMLKDTGISDANGIYIFRLKALGGINVWTDLNGYYTSIAPAKNVYPVDERFRFDAFNRDGIDKHDLLTGKVKPPMKKEVKLEASVTLREIKNPIPLHCKSVRMDFPARDVWLGYDLEKGDWVPPYGKGSNNDIRFRSVPKRFTRDEDGYYHSAPGAATLEINFGDHGGMVRVNKDNGWLPVSKLKMPHFAPEMGYEQLPLFKLEQETHEEFTEIKKANAYFLRVRVKKENEKIISAHYGKIGGRIIYFPEQRDKAFMSDNGKNLPAFGGVEFTYYFNPTANDRNLEFDTKRNLLPERNVQDP